MRGALFALSLVAGCTKPAEMPKPEARHGTSMQIDVPMRDDTPLYTKVHLPDGDGPFPTVFIRAPYDMGVILDQRCTLLTRHGYACVWQYVRGRAKSGGQWVPFEHEPNDGKDALYWLTQQPWMDGNIALMGESYLGAVQWAVAHDLPPEVKTLIPSVIGTDMYAAAYEGGLFRHEILTAWMSLMPDHEMRILGGSAGYRDALEHRPRIEADVVATERRLPWFEVWQESPRPTDPFWTRRIAQRAAEAPAELDIPVLMIGGWGDAFLGPQLATWDKLATKSRSSLVIGPWDHLGRVVTDVKQRGLDDDIGVDARGSQWARVIDWLDNHLRGEALQYPTGVVTYPVNGDGWARRGSWPPATTDVTFHLAPGADPVACTGALTDAPSSGATGWTYDPQDPTPSLGGAGLLAGVLPGWKGVKPGFLDQGDLCQARPDLLGFVSAPLAAPLHVAGPLRAALVVASTAEDTAVNVRVLEQRAGGERIHVREGIVALSYRDGADVVAPYTPGEQVVVPIETWPVEYVFEAGSQVLVEVASASFPKYEAHANVRGHWAHVETTVPATQTLILDGSAVTLPVIQK